MATISEMKVRGNVRDIMDKTARAGVAENAAGISALQQALQPSATNADVGKFLRAKVVNGNKVTQYELASGTQVDGTLTKSGKAADAGVVGRRFTDVNSLVIRKNGEKVNKPVFDPDGEDGQVLMTHGNGTTEWVTPGTPSEEQARAIIGDWLDEHPEAVTTVEDGAVGRAKLSGSLYTEIYSGLQNSIDMDYCCTVHRKYPHASLGINEPSECQGLAVIGSNRVVSFYATSYDTGNGWGLENDPTLVIEFELTANKTGSTIVRQTVLTGLAHANAAGYNPVKNEIYVCQRGYSNGSSVVNSNKIVIIDYATLTVKETVAIDMTEPNVSYIDLLSFDKTTGTLYGFTGNKLYTIDLDAETATTVFTLTSIYDRSDLEYLENRQGLTVVGDLMYLTAAGPNLMYIYSISQEKRLKILNIPNEDADGHIIAYTEDFDYDPDTEIFYMNVFHGLDIVGNGNETPYTRACYIFAFNPMKGAINIPRRTNLSDRDIGNIVYVDSGATSIYQKGSSAYPFKTINEAIHAARYSDIGYFYIRVAEGTVYDETVYLQSVNVSFSGSFTANGMRVQDCLVRFEQDITFTGDNNTSTVNIYGSVVNFDSLYATGNDSNNIAVIKYSDITGANAFFYNENAARAIELDYSRFDMFLSNSSTNQKILINRSRVMRRLPTYAQAVVSVSGECLLNYANQNASYTVGSFEGLVQATLNIHIGDSKTVFATSSTWEKRAENDAYCDVQTWFGVIRVKFDKDLNVTHMYAIYCDPASCQSESGSELPITLTDGTEVDAELRYLRLE